MSLIPNIVCRRCKREFSPFRFKCPYCGEKRAREVRRAVPESDSAVRGTEAARRSAEDMRWQMLIGSGLIVCLVAAVIAIVSVSVNQRMELSRQASAEALAAAVESTTTSTAPPETDLDSATLIIPALENPPEETDGPFVTMVPAEESAAAEYAPAANAEATPVSVPTETPEPTPEPTPEATVTSITIFWYTQEIDVGFCDGHDTTYDLDAVTYPITDEAVEVTWTSSNENVATVNENGVVHIVGYYQQSCTITASAGGCSKTITIWVG